MIDTVHFKTWLKENTYYSDAVISDTISRLKRANAILEITEEEVYIFYLERMPEFKKFPLPFGPKSKNQLDFI